MPAAVPESQPKRKSEQGDQTIGNAFSYISITAGGTPKHRKLSIKFDKGGSRDVDTVAMPTITEKTATEISDTR